MLKKEFYLRSDVCQIARELIGKVLITNNKGVVTAGIIVETEAYTGVNDKASHSYLGRITNRNKVMYAEGGRTYVYLCYGLHHLLNIVTNTSGIPQAVLIRGILPVEGPEIMAKT